MRPSLENIEFIENYILGNFDPREQDLAKQRIEQSPELSRLLETQQCIYSATRRKELRSEIQSYAPTASLSFFQQYRNWFIGGIATLAIIACFLIFNSIGSTQKQSTGHVNVVTNEKDIVPWIPFDVQFHHLNAEIGGTIVGKDGTLIILGSNSLIDADGKRIKGKVKAELIEAIDWEDMLAYNLTTTSNGKALSSGGMMRIRYRQNGQEVFVDPKKPMLVEIPTDNYNPDMKVWEGEVKGDQLDWKNPQAIERYLTPINLRDLDFVPNGFDAEVSSILPFNGHHQVSKQLVDSLYYSIAKNREAYSLNRDSKSSFVNDCYFDIPKREDLHGHPRDQTKPLLKGQNSVTGQIVDPEGKPISGMTVKLRMDRYLEHENPVMTNEKGYFTFNKFYPGEVSIYASLHSDDRAEILWKYCLESTFECPKNPKNYTLKKPLIAEYSSKVNFEQLSVLPKTNGLFIDPLTIKTLKTSRFQKTFVATKEFEERLQAMHQLKKGAVLLETYISNISEPLWKCDAMAASLLTGSDKQIFMDFAAQKLTNVQNHGTHQEALMEFYSSQRKVYRAENKRLLKEYQSKTITEITALAKSIETSLDDRVTLAEAQAEYKGRGITSSKLVRTSSRPIKPRAVRTDAYTFLWSSNAWCNIDMLMRTIGPAPWVTAVNTNKGENDITIYQTLPEMRSVIELIKQDGSFRAISSRTQNYGDIFCLGMYVDADQLYYGGSSYDPETTRDLNLVLAPVSEDEFYTGLCTLAPSQSIITSRLRCDLINLKAQAKIKAENEPFTRALIAAKNKITSEVIVYNRLFEFLDRSNKN